MERLRPALLTIARWIPAALWAGVIFAASSLPGSAVPSGLSIYGHLTEYAVLGALVVAAQRTRDAKRALLVALAACALYGVSDEVHQAFVPMRTPDVLDVLTDVAGAAVGSSAVLALRSAHARGERLIRQ